MIPLSKADKIAAKILAELAPFCQRIEIAGSIRRRRPVVGDIDIVLLPKPGQDKPLRDRLQLHCSTVANGPQTMILRLGLAGPQLDVWFADAGSSDLFQSRPGNFGTLLLARTGSKEHNIWLCQRALDRGVKWNPHFGLFRRQECIASETEEDIFRALGLAFIPPESRER